MNKIDYFFHLGKEGEQFDITKNGKTLAPCIDYEKDFPKDEESTTDVGNVDEPDDAGLKRTLGIDVVR